MPRGRPKKVREPDETQTGWISPTRRDDIPVGYPRPVPKPVKKGRKDKEVD